MRPQSDKKLATEEAPKSREFLSSLATAETARTASHIIIAGNAMLSSSASPLLSSSLNSIFSSVATAITYGRTPQKIQQARLKDLKTLLENSRPLFALEMQTFFAESTSYQKLKKQFEALDQKYFAALESEFKTFQPLMLAIGSIGVFYFVARLLQENAGSDALTWIEAAFMISIISLMGYSNFQSHQNLLMCSRKDYQEFIQALIIFQIKMFDEVPILKVMATLEQTKKEMNECIEELKRLGIEIPKTREADEGGVEESKGAGKSLAELAEAKLQSLAEERDNEIEEIQQQKEVKLTQVITLDRREEIEQEIKEAKKVRRLEYQENYLKLISLLETFNTTIKNYQIAFEQLLDFYAVAKVRLAPYYLNDDELRRLKRFSIDLPENTSARDIAAEDRADIRLGIR